MKPEVKINRCGQAEPLTQDQFRKILNSFELPSHRLIFALCWYTTERPGAILKLRQADAYSNRQPRMTIVIPCHARKDRKTREVPVSPALKSELKLYPLPKSDWLFPGRCPNKPLTLRAYALALEFRFEQMGLQGFSTYSTRRGSLTHLSRSGIGTRQIQALSGHASLGALSRYLEVSPVEVATVARCL